MTSLNLGTKLKILRKGRKLTQHELAEKLGISRATISNYEIGRRKPNLTELQRFADIFGVGLDYFGITSRDEMFDLLSRARDVFDNEDIPKEAKQELYEELMRLYLNLK